MGKGDPRRRDLLDMLSGQVGKVDLGLATEIAHACMAVAGRFSHDFLFERRRSSLRPENCVSRLRT